MGVSLSRGGLGFLAALAIGTPLGLLIARVHAVRRGIGPLVSGLQSLPSVAWVPAAIIFFGIGNAAIYAVVLLGAVPSIANGMVSGIDQVPPLYRRVGQVLGARGLRRLPARAAPRCAARLRGRAAPGLGLLLAVADGRRADREVARARHRPGAAAGGGRFLQDMSLVFAGILGILVVGIAVELLLFAPLERRVLRRRGLLLAAH
jgi:NitT/TauT family transport system permease protein